MIKFFDISDVDFEYSRHLNDAAKLQIQIVALLKSLAKDYFSINSKSDLFTLKKQKYFDTYELGKNVI